MDPKAFAIPEVDSNNSLSPPFIQLPHIQNLRGVGPLPLPDFDPSSGISHVLRPGILFRSADPYNTDPQELIRLGISKVYDLRSLPETKKGLGWAEDTEGKNTAPDGIQRLWTPVFEAEDYSPERLAQRFAMYMDERVEGFVSAYKDILTNAGPAYSTILRELASSPTPGILVHCTAGKDRTGMFFGILLSLLGAEDQVIADEYNLTETGLSNVKAVFVQNISARLKTWATTSGEAEVPKDIPDDPEEQEKRFKAMAERSVGARKESMLGALEMVRETFGGPEAYLKAVCKLDDATIDAVKKNLVLTGEDM